MRQSRVPSCPNSDPPYSYVPHSETKPYFDMGKRYVVGDQMYSSNFDGSSFVSHQYIIAAQAESSVDYPVIRPFGAAKEAPAIIFRSWVRIADFPTAGSGSVLTILHSAKKPTMPASRGPTTREGSTVTDATSFGTPTKLIGTSSTARTGRTTSPLLRRSSSTTSQTENFAR